LGTINVILHESSSSRLFWEALAHALRSGSRLNVIGLENISEIIPTLNRISIDILICGNLVDLSDRKLFQLYPDLIIIRVDESNAKTIVRSSQSILVNTQLHFDDPDCSGFLDLINQLVPLSVTKIHHDKPVLELLTTKIVDEIELTPEVQTIRKAHEFGVEYETVFAETARRWVESIIIERLVTLLRNESIDSARIAGWGLATRDACYLLGANPDTINVDSVRSDRLVLEKSLFYRGDIEPNTRFHWFAKIFKLDVFQQQIVLLALAPEIDGRISQVYGCLNNDMTRRWATQFLLNELPDIFANLEQRLIQEIHGDSRLIFLGILVHDETYALPICDLAIKVSDDVRRFLVSGEFDNSHSAFNYYSAESSGKPGRSTCALRKRLEEWLSESEEKVSVLNLDAGFDGQRWFIRGATEIGLGVVKIDTAVFQKTNLWDVKNTVLCAIRVALLSDSVVFVAGLSLISNEFRQSIESIVLDLLTTHAPLLVIEGRFTNISAVNMITRLKRNPLSVSERADVWLDYAERLDIGLTHEQAQELGSWARFNEADVEQTLFFCRDKLVDMQHFRKAARHVSSTNIPGSVHCLPAQFTWDDIVLPDHIIEVLRRIPNHITHREKVLSEWGYRERMSYGLGTACLFSGASGTGKTMASQIIASAIGEAEIFQCDLAKTVSKYIGETEKNLDTIFDAAEKARAVLVFNEADVLFGKRTEIKDAHDRYANLEVGYLLQRMESYDGLVILTTNSRASMDIAFLRRLRFIVEFPVPPASDRELIWERVFPDKFKRADDVTFSYLAQQLDLNGGHIQQIAIIAAYAAAAEGCEKLHMRHVISATREELTKIGMDSAQRILDEVAA